MPTAEAPAAPPPPAEAPPAGPTLAEVAEEAAAQLPAPAPGEERHFVEQKVLDREVRTRNYDDPDDDAADPPLLRALPASMREAVAYPLTYRLAASSGHPGLTVRQAASAPDRATQYICLPFYKPLSRCFGGRG
jgi:hypothetical protein